MDELESRLRAALRRQAPPAGFAERVLSQVEAEAARPRPAARWGRSRVRVFAAAAALLLATGLGIAHHERRAERRNRAALAKALTALSLAAEHLDRTQDKAFANSRRGHVARRLSRLSFPGAGSPSTHSKQDVPRI
jgi:hypothetical protein